jgi:fatty acid desaturase
MGALILVTIGLGALSLSLTRHHRDLLKRTLPRRMQAGLRLAGWALLLMALATLIASLGPAFGIISWIGLLTLGMIIVTTLLTHFSP